MHFSKRTYVTRGELAAELRVTKATIRQWEALRGFPQPLPGSGRVPLYTRQLMSPLGLRAMRGSSHE